MNRTITSTVGEINPSRDRCHRQGQKMKKEKDLCDGRCTQWWLNTEDSTDLWSEELLLYEIDLFNRHEQSTVAWAEAS